MTTFRNDGAWGAGKGSRLTSLELDNNFWGIVQEIEDLISGASGAGKLITDVTYAGGVLTFEYSDGSSDTIPLPVATLNFPAELWLNSTSYQYLDVILSPNLGQYVVLRPHTTPAAPAPFDPNALDGEGNPLYSLLLPPRDVDYDVAMFVPGLVQRAEDTLLANYIVPRALQMVSGLGGAAWAFLGTVITGGTDIELAIEKNGTTLIGTITFTTGDEEGTISFPDDVDFVGGDRVGVRVVSSTDPTAADLSITLPAMRTDTP